MSDSYNITDEVVMWFRVADIKQHEELKTIFTVRNKCVANIFESLHEKSYNLDWRHKLLERCHKLAEKILICRMCMVHFPSAA